MTGNELFALALSEVLDPAWLLGPAGKLASGLLKARKIGTAAKFIAKVMSSTEKALPDNITSRMMNALKALPERVPPVIQDPKHLFNMLQKTKVPFAKREFDAVNFPASMFPIKNLGHQETKDLLQNVMEAGRYKVKTLRPIDIDQQVIKAVKDAEESLGARLTRAMNVRGSRSYDMTRTPLVGLPVTEAAKRLERISQATRRFQRAEKVFEGRQDQKDLLASILDEGMGFGYRNRMPATGARNRYLETLLQVDQPLTGSSRFREGHFDTYEPIRKAMLAGKSPTYEDIFINSPQLRGIVGHVRSMDNPAMVKGSGELLPARHIGEMQSTYHQALQRIMGGIPDEGSVNARQAFGMAESKVPLLMRDDPLTNNDWARLLMRQQIADAHRRGIQHITLPEPRQIMRITQGTHPEGFDLFYGKQLPKMAEEIIGPYGGHLDEYVHKGEELFRRPGFAIPPDLGENLLKYGIPMMGVLPPLALAAGMGAGQEAA